MAHNLFGSRFLGHRTPAWHKLGQVFTDDSLTASDGMRQIHMDYLLEKFHPQIMLPNGQIITSENVSILRHPTHDDPNYVEVATGVPANYGLLQNMEIAQILDGILSERKGWRLETLGALGKGERMFATLQVPSYSINGDEIERYLLLTDDRDGKHAFSIVPTQIRVVCQNTLTAALKNVSVQVQLQHTANILEDVTQVAGLIAGLEEAQSAVSSVMQRFADKVLTPLEIASVFSATYRTREGLSSVGTVIQQYKDAGKALTDTAMKKYEEAQGWAKMNQVRMAKRIDAANELLGTFNDQFPQSANTAYAAYNVVAEIEDNVNGKGEVATAKEVLWGERATHRNRAFEKCFELVTA